MQLACSINKPAAGPFYNTRGYPTFTIVYSARAISLFSGDYFLTFKIYCEQILLEIQEQGIIVLTLYNPFVL
jgi:hypothetical protein